VKVFQKGIRDKTEWGRITCGNCLAIMMVEQKDVRRQQSGAFAYDLGIMWSAWCTCPECGKDICIKSSKDLADLDKGDP
jgi:hypothetical protein